MARGGKLNLKDSRGETTVEFALIAVVLMLIVFGIIEGGRLFSAWLIITNETREAARYGAVCLGDPARQPTLATDLVNRVYQRTAGILERAKLTPSASISPDPNAPQWVTVRVDYNAELLAGPLLFWLPNPIPLSAVSTMRAEDGPVGGG